MSGPDYLFLISNGFSARMICQTDLLPGLRRAGLRIGILTADREDPSLLRLAADHGVELYQYDVSRSVVVNQLFDLRKYFLNDIEKNPALLEKYMSRKLAPNRSLSRKIQNRLAGGLYWLGQHLPGLRPGYQWLEKKMLRSAAAERLLRDIDPGCLVCTYPVLMPEPEFLLAARALGIPSVLHLLSWDNVPSKGVFPALADRYVVWGAAMEKDLLDRYPIAAKDVYRCGVPHFDRHLRAAARLPERSEKRYLFFAMSAPRYGPHEIDIVEWLAGRVSQGAFGDDVGLIVRPHPQNVHGYLADSTWLPRIDALAELPGVEVSYPRMNKDSKLLFSIDEADMEAFTTVLAGAAIVLNSGSTVSIDAMMTDRPVILTSFDADRQLGYWFSARRLKDYLHLADIIRCGGIRVTTSYDELAAAIRAYLGDPSLDREGRQRTIEHYCLAADGQATNRAIGYYLDNAVTRED